MYDIRLKQIECFLDISQTLSFTESAKRLHISQPLASKWIRSIEDERRSDCQCLRGYGSLDFCNPDYIRPRRAFKKLAKRNDRALQSKDGSYQAQK